MTTEVLTVSELSARLRIGRSSAYRLVKDGMIRSVRIGRTIRVPETAVQEFLSGARGDVVSQKTSDTTVTDRDAGPNGTGELTTTPTTTQKEGLGAEL